MNYDYGHGGIWRAKNIIWREIADLWTSIRMGVMLNPSKNPDPFCLYEGWCNTRTPIDHLEMMPEKKKMGIRTNNAGRHVRPLLCSFLLVIAALDSLLRLQPNKCHGVKSLQYSWVERLCFALSNNNPMYRDPLTDPVVLPFS